jgi:hypothetical protein
MEIVIVEADRQRAFALFDQGESINRVAALVFGGHWYKAKKLQEEFSARTLIEGSPSEDEPAVDARMLRDGSGDDRIGGAVESEVTEETLRAELMPTIAEPGESLDEEEEPDVWDLTVQVPKTRMDRIIANFTSQEKADAIAMVLTARMAAEA